MSKICKPRTIRSVIGCGHFSVLLHPNQRWRFHILGDRGEQGQDPIAMARPIYRLNYHNGLIILQINEEQFSQWFEEVPDVKET